MTFEEFGLNRDTLPIILMVLLGLLFMAMGRGDASVIPNITKKMIAVGMGIALGILFMFYNMELDPQLKPTLTVIIKYVFGGLMMGANAIGLDQLTKGGK